MPWDPPRGHGPRLARWPKRVLIGALVLHPTALVLMLARVEPFYTGFYSWAWWTYILALVSLNRILAGHSLILDGYRPLFRLILFSSASWLFFEACNLRLQNWHYIGVPEENWLRWPGYPVAFGTVFAGLFETAYLLKNLTWFEGRSYRPLRVGRHTPWLCWIVGALFLSLALRVPNFFFPLIWIAPLLLADPLLYWSKHRRASLLSKAQTGDYSLIGQLTLAGPTCGVLWEFWNYWAGAKWEYTIPYFGFWKIFEMPILGFLGYCPFALSCYALYQLLLLLDTEILESRPLLRSLALIALLGAGVWVVGQLEQQTVWSYKPWWP